MTTEIQEEGVVLGFQNETAIPFDETETSGVKLNKQGKVKVPRRLIHCSDGILEEYSTDEEEEEEEPQPVVDPTTLTWGPYFWYWTVRSAVGGLAACDFLGEKLAYFFGITSPKYAYAIREIERMKEEEEEEREQEEEERRVEEEMIQNAINLGKVQVKDNTMVASETGDH